MEVQTLQRILTKLERYTEVPLVGLSLISGGDHSRELGRLLHSAGGAR